MKKNILIIGVIATIFCKNAEASFVISNHNIDTKNMVKNNENNRYIGKDEDMINALNNIKATPVTFGAMEMSSKETLEEAISEITNDHFDWISFLNMLFNKSL